MAVKRSVECYVDSTEENIIIAGYAEVPPGNTITATFYIKPASSGTKDVQVELYGV